MNIKQISNKDVISKISTQQILALGSFMILAIVLFWISNISFMGSAPDELGYLSTSYKLAGWNWNEAFQNYPFYGVGIGILWAPLFLIFDDFIIIYKCILLLNGLFLVLSYWISFLCAKQMFQRSNPKILAVICLCVSFYPSNMFYVQNALTETLLYLLFWITLYLVLKIIKQDKWYWFILLAGVQSYMIIVHMRTIIIVIATGCFLLLHAIRNKKSNILIFFGIVLMGIVAMKFIQTQYIENASSVINTINTDTGVVEKIHSILLNPIDFIINILGQIFAWTVSGNIIFFAGGIFCIKKSFEFIKTKNILNECCFFLFVVAACCLGAFASNRFVLHRLDTIVYLRYIENTIGSFLMLGMSAVVLKCQKVNQYFQTAFVLLLLIANWLVLRKMNFAESNIFDISSSVVLGSFFDYYVSGVDNAFTLLKVISIALVFAFAVFILIRLSKGNSKCMLAVLCMALLCYWGYMGHGAMEKQMEMKDTCYRQYSEVVEKIKSKKYVEVVYWQESLENNDLKKAKYLQALLGKEALGVVSDQMKDIEKLEKKGTLFLTDKDDDSLRECQRVTTGKLRKVFSTELFDGYLCYQ